MTLSEVIQELNGRGIQDVTRAKIHYAIDTGKVDKPPLNGSLQFQFGKQHVKQIATYLSKPRKRGPKKAGATT
jgi:hypothetical protein